MLLLFSALSVTSLDILLLTCVVDLMTMLAISADIQHRVEQALGGALDSQMCIHEVRLVAPNKKMLCLTFRIPADVAFATSPEVSKVNAAGELNSVDNSAEQQTKRQRTLQ